MIAVAADQKLLDAERSGEPDQIGECEQPPHRGVARTVAIRHCAGPERCALGL
jgi:hypothetical protein